jgi:uncharacterized protein (UPF0332 family)
LASELSTRLVARLEKAKRKLATAKRLLDEGEFEDAAGRAYYAMYHAAHAALLPKRASPRTHKGLAMMLSMHRVKVGDISIDLYRAFVAARDQREYGPHEILEFLDAPLHRNVNSEPEQMRSQPSWRWEPRAFRGSSAVAAAPVTSTWGECDEIKK